MRTFPLGPDGIQVTAAHFSEIPADVVAEIKGLGHGSVMAVLGNGFSNIVKNIRAFGIHAIGVDPVYHYLKDNPWQLDLIKAKVDITDEMLMNLCRIFFQQAKENDPDADPREIAEDIQHKLDAHFSSVASAEQSYSNLCIIPGGKMPSLPRELQYVAANIYQIHRQSFREWVNHYGRHSSQYYFPAYAEAPPFRDESVDAIFSWHFLYPHVTKTDREFMLKNILQEIRRVLAPGGKIFIGPLGKKELILPIALKLGEMGFKPGTQFSSDNRVAIFQRDDDQGPRVA